MSGRRKDWCKHYRAMSNHDACKAGVLFATLRGIPHEQCPCFSQQPESVPVACSLAVYRTPEEIEAEEKWLKERIANVGKARTAIVEHLGGPWKRGMAGASGQIPCPVCSTGNLRFSRAGINGHVHAQCNTPDCVGWME
jgi:hypothetical protein